ncbi:ABC transporter substrate-binding protein [Magnetovibrio sp. PR-2]|uniref:ABC transporter substrate-binding protein n=1 Tax=Magnetovibrio sp. PR-2 TaxID=3120356 RepID=UPI002FCDFCF0
MLPKLRRLPISTALLLASSLWLGACSQEEQKPKDIGFMLGVDVFTNVYNGFKDGMTERGYTEGQTVNYFFGSAKSNKKTMASICRQFVQQKVDLVVTTTNGGALACKEALKGTSIPMVFTVVLSPVGSGVVDDMQSPSGNITGVRNPLNEFIGKRLEFLNALSPESKRVWLPYTPKYPTTKHFLGPLRKTAEMFDLTLVETEVNSTGDLLQALEQNPEPPFDAIFIAPNLVPQSKAGFGALKSYADQHGLPIVGNTFKQVEQGALFSYHVDKFQVGKQAAYLTDQILSTQDHIAFPVINSEPSLFLNMELIKKLGLQPSETLMSLSANVVE